MRKLIGIGLLLLAMVALVPSESYAGKAKSYHTTVGVYVTADNNDKALVESYFGRELRSLGDVSVDNNEPQYELAVVLLQTQNKSGTFTGYAIATAISYKLADKFLAFAAKPGFKKSVEAMTSGSYIYDTTFLVVGSPNELKKICSETVASFDSNVLQKDRELFDKVQNLTNKH